MGQPVVHFEIVGKDGAKLREFYGQLFDWTFDTSAPMDYGTVDRESNLSPEGIGIGGGVGTGPDDYPGHVTFYIAVDDVEAALAKAESLGGKRVLGPEKIMDTIELGLINDPEGHLVGVVKTQ
jgi:predicted enzyme related to lactoylglutathione lyase